MPKNPKPKPDTLALPDSGFPPDWHYEQAVDQIEAVIAQIEGGDLSLAEVFTQFESAVAEIRRCEAFLQQHQAQVGLLIETLNDSA